MVTTSSGETFAYTETEAGVYQADFRGVVRESYTLTVQTRDGQQYVSTPEELRPVAPLDSVYTTPEDTAEALVPRYYPAWDYTDPAGTEDYYRWKFYVNNAFQDQTDALLVLSDEFIDGEANSRGCYPLRFTEYTLAMTRWRLRTFRISVTGGAWLSSGIRSWEGILF